MKRQCCFLFVVSCILLITCSCSADTAPYPCNSNEHIWKYNTETETKTCSICGENEGYIPSGYYLNSIQVEYEGSKPYFNEEHILCTYDEATYKKFNQSKSSFLVESLLADKKLFYVEENTTCDILPDTNKLAPQYHIVITSGEHNGDECWTSMAVVVNAESVKSYKAWLESPDNPINRDNSNSDGDADSANSIP